MVFSNANVAFNGTDKGMAAVFELAGLEPGEEGWKGFHAVVLWCGLYHDAVLGGFELTGADFAVDFVEEGHGGIIIDVWEWC
jgi:hypothetical protein